MSLCLTCEISGSHVARIPEVGVMAAKASFQDAHKKSIKAIATTNSTWSHMDRHKGTCHIQQAFPLS